ncbi:MAG: glycosyl transferase family protein [Alphaproteobacteria bacterium]|nr:glycosyl transferase family protein [Alphaproteobacteria bacterium]MBV9372946.1 glycosyl transferase family protein [Alphaproteobacteria bacterium]MBV9900935.1 glycosyl transferase family protein [Alphaproteobacteria bacterium]
MTLGWLLLRGLELVLREAALFAGAGFALLGAEDLAVDLAWLAMRVRGLPEPPPPGPATTRVALFIPAWDEAAVIGPMLRATLAALGPAEGPVYVGCYPNDPETAAAAAEAARGDPRVRLVVGPRPGPTSKADCLNGLWEALRAEEAAGAARAEAVLLHDAEDVVHPAALSLVAGLVGRFDLVQLPVLPLIDPGSRWLGGHYADEFAQAHGKELVVRQALGAALPSAGVGCALSRAALDALAAAGGGRPFDADSLTEDYELGLRLAEAGGTAAFVRARAADGSLIATREYFPGTLAGAVRQKGRWIAGIALAGWDRLGWRGGLAERWMRFRDRRALLAALLLLCGYAAAGAWLLLKLVEGLGGPAPAPLPPTLSWLLRLNLGLLLWRLGMRALFTGRAYGWREGLRAVPRAAVANVVAILAAGAALARYRTARRTGRNEWGKTEHRFPAGAGGG